MRPAFPKPNMKKERREKLKRRAIARSKFHMDVMEAARGRCENPYCMSVTTRISEALHAHHIVKRSHGGPDIKENGVAFCVMCHFYAHHGKPTRNGSPHLSALQFQIDILRALKDRPGFRHGEVLAALELKLPPSS